jgi:CubicO group peptidase (beta-lactamase class C family)
MKRGELLIILPLLILAGSCQSAPHAPEPQNAVEAMESQVPALAVSFIEALNTKDQAKIRDFISKQFDSTSVSVDERTSRLTGIAKDYGPFTLGNLVRQSAREIVLQATDGQGTNIQITLQLTDAGKIKGIMLGPGGGPPPKEYKNWSDLSALASEIVAEEKLPGMAIAALRDGNVEVAVSGKREVGKPEDAQKSDTWLVGSIGKSMTATMIARLIDQGKLRWDSTIGEVLPDYGFRPEFKDITILQILRHRSGLVQDEGVRKPFVDSIAAAAGSTDPVKIRAAYVKNILSREPIGKPGERMAYSNAGYAVAAHMAEKVSGKPFADLMTELVFKPLGMSSAGVDKSAPGSPNTPGQPHGHAKGPGGEFRPMVVGGGVMSEMFAGAGGGIYMSIEDLLKFANYHLKGLRGEVTLMSKANFDQIHETPEPSGQMAYGCGFGVISEVTPEPFHGHNGSDGTFMAEMAIFPKSNIAVVAITNAGEERMMTPSLQAVVAYWNKHGKR